MTVVSIMTPALYSIFDEPMVIRLLFIFKLLGIVTLLLNDTSFKNVVFPVTFSVLLIVVLPEVYNVDDNVVAPRTANVLASVAFFIKVIVEFMETSLTTDTFPFIIEAPDMVVTPATLNMLLIVVAPVVFNVLLKVVAPATDRFDDNAATPATVKLDGMVTADIKSTPEVSRSPFTVNDLATCNVAFAVTAPAVSNEVIKAALFRVVAPATVNVLFMVVAPPIINLLFRETSLLTTSFELMVVAAPTDKVEFIVARPNDDVPVTSNVPLTLALPVTVMLDNVGAPVIFNELILAGPLTVIVDDSVVARVTANGPLTVAVPALCNPDVDNTAVDN